MQCDHSCVTSGQASIENNREGITSGNHHTASSIECKREGVTGTGGYRHISHIMVKIKFDLFLDLLGFVLFITVQKYQQLSKILVWKNLVSHLIIFIEMLLVWKNLVTNRALQIIHFAHVTPVMAASQIYIRYGAICQYFSLM